MEISRDFKELLELFNARKVEYMIVGAYAMAFYGAPRFTGDLDIFVRPDRENARRILQTLSEFGFGSLQLTEADFSQADNVIQLGYPPVRIDLLTALTGLAWEQVNSGKTAGQFGGVRVFYIGKNELIQNKRAVGRKKDLADIETLEEK